MVNDKNIVEDDSPWYFDKTAAVYCYSDVVDACVPEPTCQIPAEMVEQYTRGRIETDRTLGFVTVVVPHPKDGACWTLQRMTLDELLRWMSQ